MPVKKDSRIEVRLSPNQDALGPLSVFDES